MKNVFCIALEGNGPTGVDWYRYKENRELAKGTTGAEKEVYFDLQVPVNASDEEITDLADDAAWNKTHFPRDEAYEIDACLAD